METGLAVALGGAAALLLAMLCVLLALAVSGRRRMQRDLAAARADVDTLRARLEDLEASRVAPAAAPVVPQVEYLITTAGAASAERVPNRVVLSAAFGEPLVKVVAFGFGLRRALSPESRNRIAFEVRREVKRARKQRRRATKRAARQAAAGGVGREAA
jgi:hypothetical protein